MPAVPLSNAEIADRLASLAQLLSAQNDNPYKVRAYQRAAAKIRTLPESIDDLVRANADLTRYSGIGEAIASAIREIVLTGTLEKLERLRASATAEIAELSAHPRLDPKRVFRAYKKLGIGSIEALRERLESGEVERALGGRMAQHFRQGLVETHAMLLYRADDLHANIQDFLLGKCGVRRSQAAGDYRRRVEVIEELDYLVETDDFDAVVARMERYGGRTPLVALVKDEAVFALSAGILLRLRAAWNAQWGLSLMVCTGSKAHLRKLARRVGGIKRLAERGPWLKETSLYREFGLSFIPPELREGRDEVELAAKGRLPLLVEIDDVRGELHAHTTASDGSHSIPQMAKAARERGYEYLGITDHSQSLKIAGGVPVNELWKQIRAIDRLNERSDVRVLKSAEVDILPDGSLDYPDDLLRELDYTVCSIHSRFGLDRKAQTERVMRAMDNRYFHILGHATGRLLLKRSGYELDMDRIIEHARKVGCFFEINSSPDRLDLSAAHARAAAAAGVKIAVATDAHSTREFDLVRYGLDQARRAGLTKKDVLNCLPWTKLAALFRR
jgi:DNA polymerase (family 10)